MANRKQTTVPFLAGLFRTRSNEFFIAELQRRGIEDLVPAHGDLFTHLFGGGSLTVTELAERTGRTKSTVSVLAGKREGGLPPSRTRSPGRPGATAEAH